ncbi:alpha/beta fold hydrolase [Marinicella sp. W31]|uniref:alpha/beta hydrolase n=1 Tax=Marinicella sp. W31 TaxID=3023713 RepID=UPI0037575602
MKYLLLLFITLSSGAFAASAETPFTFEDANGQKVAAFKGVFSVPENRNKTNSRRIDIHYVRFPATGKTPGHPIVYLAGGPGGSGIATAKYRRFQLFMAMREFGDVIALDQRGTGDSDDLPKCTSQQVLPRTPISDQQYISIKQQALRECLSFWQQQKVDLSAYNTLENAADLNALRLHLNAEKITLWGISYGSHLALSALKTMPEHIHKVIIASAEGLRQTIKMPARTDAYFARLQKAVDKQLGSNTFDIRQLMKKVHDKLDQQPLKINLSTEDPENVYYLQRRDMQQMASGMISDPNRAWQLIQLYQAVDANFIMPLIPIIQGYFGLDESISFRAMSIAMDIASGIDSDRRKVIEQQAQSALLATYLNFTLHYTDIASQLDLGDAFRKPPSSHVPTLLLSGTLDGRTYVESQREAVAGLSNCTIITVVNAGHNLFKSSPEVLETMQAFMRDETISHTEILTQLPAMTTAQ